MTEGEWARARQIVGEARVLAEPDRDAFLDRACAGDAALREQVDMLLRSHRQEGGFPKDPTAEPAETGARSTVAATGGEEPGEVIDRYTLLQRIGEGGFGSVWMAEQREPVRRRVALKIVKLGMDTRQVIARFEAERQALAMMDHPGIAKVFDAGATETGRPYFVMELVKGVPITRYADTENLSTAERLRLFVEVCRAVQHAHQKGIIHRDIKPSNVLVALQDGRPAPKVIDFGIAKATSQHLTERSVFTEHGQFIGTPAYMSPEQAEMTGLDVDTRTDIYSLGVLLYELLTGTTPFDPQKLRSAGFLEICRIIREVEPPRPSTRLNELTGQHGLEAAPEAPTVAADPTPSRLSGTASLEDIAKHRRTQPAQLTRQLRGDLDWIVMRALEKSRTRRYETANGLALDVERYLNDEPVTATPPSVAYRMRKFVRRNRGLVGSVAAIFVALAAGVVGTTAGMLRARAAEQVAVEERRSVEHLLTFMLGDLKDELEPIGRLDALDGAARQVVAYYARRPAADLDGEDLLQYGQGLELVGRTQLSRAELEAAESAFREEVKLLDELRRQEPQSTECLFWLSQAHFYLGAVAYRRDDPDGALSGFDRYLELAEALAATDRRRPEWQLEIAYASSSRATALDELGRFDEAAQARGRSLEIKRRLVGQDPGDRDRLLALANDLTFLADTASERCDVAGAVAAAAEAHELIRGYAEAHPDDLDAAYRLSVARGKHAMYTGAAGDHESALRLFGRNQETVRRLVEVEPDNTRWRYERAVGLQLTGATLLRLGRPDEAMAELRASRVELDQLIERGSDRASTMVELDNTVRWTAEAELAAGRPERVAPLAAEARARLETMPAGEPDRILALARLDALEARALLDLGREADAGPILERALERLAPAPADLPAAAEVRATALLLLGRVEQAAPLLDRVRACAGLPAYLEALARDAGLLDRR